MTLNVTSVSVRLAGHAAADIVSLEVDGVAVAIAGDRSWSIAIDVPALKKVVAITAIGPTRVVTRALTVQRVAAGAAAG